MGRERLLSDDVVKLTEAASELEAAEICGYLQSQGIRATDDKGGILGYSGLVNTYDGGNVGRQEIVVRAADLESALAALASLPGNA